MNALDFIKEHKVVAISRGVYGKELLESVKAVALGGIHVLEITFNQASKTCIDDTASSIALVKKELGDTVCVGAGTVMSIEQARAAHDAGADFALAPNVDLKVIHEIKRLGMIAVPGAFSPSEIVEAFDAGADIVKVFPAAQLGAEYIKAIRGPINHIPLMAVGGVSVDNIQSFFASGCMSVGIGSNIISSKKAQAGDFLGMSTAAKAFINAIA